MINLLPQKEKERLLLETKKRLVIIIWCLFCFFIFCFILVLISIKFYLQGQADSLKITLQEIKKGTEQSEIQSFQEKFNAFNISLTKLNSFYQQRFYFSEALEKTSKILPKEAYLTNISATFTVPKEESPYIQIILSGFIPNREDLFEFKKNLEKEKGVKDVSFPPANWIKPIDIDFSVMFKIIK